jgi:hypothetical protein
MSATGTATIGDRVSAAARRGFVGRRDELALFNRLLSSPHPRFAVLWFVGPGGIGKSRLLAHFADLARAAGRRTITVDGALIDPTPRSFTRAAGGPVAAGSQTVLLIDTCERLGAIQRWLRETYLPRLPGTSIVVCAGREGPDEDWQHDDRWAPLLCRRPLNGLDERDARKLLSLRGLAPAAQAPALAYARGHPLALGLLADVARQSGGRIDQGTAGPAVVQTLAERFCRDIVDPMQRDALRVAAFVRHTTEAVLAAVLGVEVAPSLFDWMRRLTFMAAAPAGLVPHELVREVLVADAVWRDPGRADAVARKACVHLYEAIACSTGARRLHFQAEVLFVMRHQPHKRPFFDWESLGRHRVEPARADEFELLAAMVHHHEGKGALGWLRHWWQRQREGFVLFRDASDRCDGFLLMLRIGPRAAATDLADPAVAAAWRFVRSRRPLAPGEELVLLRHWMHREHHQAVTAAINLTAMHVVTHLITHPEAVWSVVYMADPSFWQPHFDGVNFARCPEADFEVDGRRFGAFIHDWRFEPAPAWISGRYRPQPFATGHASAPDDGDFVVALRQALRDLRRPELLERSALVAALASSGHGTGTGEMLRRRLLDAIRRLEAHPRDRKFGRALWLTYAEPAYKQEQVAAELGIPFPTYRYRLQRGIALLAAVLREEAARH